MYRVVELSRGHCVGMLMVAERNQNKAMTFTLEMAGYVIDAQHVAAIFGKGETWGEYADCHVGV